MPEEGHNARVIDLTAYKLEKMLEDNSHDEWMHQILLDILGDYYLGQIAIGWEEGQPIIMPVADSWHWTKGIPPGFNIIIHEAARIVDKEYTKKDMELDLEFEPDDDDPDDEE